MKYAVISHGGEVVAVYDDKKVAMDAAEAIDMEGEGYAWVEPVNQPKKYPNQQYAYA